MYKLFNVCLSKSPNSVKKISEIILESLEVIFSKTSHTSHCLNDYISTVFFTRYIIKGL